LQWSNVDLQEKTQRDAEAVSSLVLLVCRVCMREEMSLERTLKRKKRKVVEA
jgi:hypothetical protein